MSLRRITPLILILLLGIDSAYAEDRCLSLLIQEALKSRQSQQLIDTPKSFNEKLFLQSLIEDNYPEYQRITSNAFSDQDYKKYLKKAEKEFINRYSVIPADAQWSAETFTDPRLHDDIQFIYLVHSVFHIDNKIDGLVELGVQDKYISIADEPHRITEMPRLAASLITHSHRSTFTNLGVILEIQPDSVIATYHADESTGGFESIADYIRNTLSLVGNTRKLFSPRTLLSVTPLNDNNEILILTRTEKGPVKVVGYFIKMRAPGVPITTQDEVDWIRASAKKNNLPVIEIRE